MIIKQPKEKTSPAVSNKRKKRYVPRGRYVEVSSLPYHLFFAPDFWKRQVGSRRFSLELVAELYRYIQANPHKTYYKFTDGDCTVHAHFDKSRIFIEDIRAVKLSRAEMRMAGYIFIFPTCVMRMDKNNHFFERWVQRRFELSLLVPLYEELRRSMPGDRVSVSDGEFKVMGRKTRGMLVVAETGVVLGEIDWDEYLDKKFIPADQ